MDSDSVSSDTGRNTYFEAVPPRGLLMSVGMSLPSLTVLPVWMSLFSGLLDDCAGCEKPFSARTQTPAADTFGLDRDARQQTPPAHDFRKKTLSNVSLLDRADVCVLCFVCIQCRLFLRCATPFSRSELFSVAGSASETTVRPRRGRNSDDVQFHFSVAQIHLLFLLAPGFRSENERARFSKC